MIDFDGLRDKAEDFVEDHADQLGKGIDKAADLAGNKFGHGDQIDQGADKLKDFLDKHDGDDEEDAAPGATPGAPRKATGQGPGARQGRPGANRPGGPGHKPGGGQRRPQP